MSEVEAREAIVEQPPLSRWSAEESAAIESLFYRSVERTFGGRCSSEGWGRLLFTPGIDEPEWNHASDIGWRDQDVDANLAAMASAFASCGRAPVVSITPWSAPDDLARRLLERGWRVRFRHLWSLYDLGRPVPLESVEPYVYTRVESPAEMEEFVELFVAVYDEDGMLAEGYAPALRRSLREPGVRHHLVRFEGAAVAIGTVLVEGERAQIFNMVVRNGHRRRGLAEWLTYGRLREAREAGARTLTAVSDNARIDRWLRARGFQPGWFSAGYASLDVPGGAG